MELEKIDNALKMSTKERGNDLRGDVLSIRTETLNQPLSQAEITQEIEKTKKYAVIDATKSNMTPKRYCGIGLNGDFSIDQDEMIMTFTVKNIAANSPASDIAGLEVGSVLKIKYTENAGENLDQIKVKIIEALRKRRNKDENDKDVIESITLNDRNDIKDSILNEEPPQYIITQEDQSIKVTQEDDFKNSVAEELNRSRGRTAQQQ